MASGPITSWQIEGEKVEALTVLFFCTPKPLQMGSATKLKDISSLEGKRYDKTRQCIKKQRHHCANKGPYTQSYVFSSSHVRMGELDHKGDLRGEELMFLNCGAGEDP